jgi:hypothetical protein
VSQAGMGEDIINQKAIYKPKIENFSQMYFIVTLSEE